MRKAIFLDRDGVINKKPAKHDYVKSWQEFEWLPRVEESIKLVNQAGWLIIVVSNQRGVARGLMSKEDLEEIHKKMIKKLEKNGAKIDRIYWCGHDYYDNCICRKPKPGLILQAAKDFHIDLANSWMIGDSNDDIEAGRRAGCKILKIKTNGSLFLAIQEIFEK